MEQQTPATRSTNKLDAGVLAFALFFVLVTQWVFYWVAHFPIEHPTLVTVLAGIIYFGLCGALGIWVLVRGIQRRIHKSLFLVAAAIVLITLSWTSPIAYPFFTGPFNWIRFQKDRQFYRETVASTEPSTVHIFKWSEGQRVWPGPRYFEYLIFDNNRVGQPGGRLGALSAAVTHPEPIGGALDATRLTSSACSRHYRRLIEGFLIVSATCED